MAPCQTLPLHPSAAKCPGKNTCSRTGVIKEQLQYWTRRGRTKFLNPNSANHHIFSVYLISNRCWEGKGQGGNYKHHPKILTRKGGIKMLHNTSPTSHLRSSGLQFRHRLPLPTKTQKVNRRITICFRNRMVSIWGAPQATCQTLWRPELRKPRRSFDPPRKLPYHLNGFTKIR